jgi:hypothetical protein
MKPLTTHRAVRLTAKEIKRYERAYRSASEKAFPTFLSQTFVIPVIVISKSHFETDLARSILHLSLRTN